VSHPASEGPPERASSAPPPAEPATGVESPEAARGATLATGATATTAPAGARDVPRTRTGAAFKTLIAGAIVLILLLVFILENTRRVKIAYFGVGFHLPLGVALLLAAIGGALLIGIVGGARIMQLRRHVRRRRR
jgi:uncharacterized integral membrane protein